MSAKITPIKTDFDTSQWRISNIQTGQYLEARINEILEFSSAISSSGGSGKRVFQKLPRYRRRRVMSYNILTMPKSLRKSARKETKEAKKPSRARNTYKRKRKLKRRFRLICGIEGKDRIRRLPTHIWHAKRFSMRKRWGVYVPIRSNIKVYRNSFRFSKNLCTTHDASYLGLIELIGTQDAIIQVLKQMSGNNNIPMNNLFEFKTHLSGSKEGEMLLVHPTMNRIIAPVQFLWRVDVSYQLNERKLWLWIHPAAYEETFSGLWDAIALANVKCRVRKRVHDFVRFEVRGDRTHNALEKTLECMESYDSTEIEKRKMFSAICSLNSAGSVSSRVVLGLRVNTKFLKAQREVEIAKVSNMDSRIKPKEALKMVSTKWDPALSLSELWEEPTVEPGIPNISNFKKERYKLRQLREQDSDTGVHILLIQRPPFLRNVGSGWDIIAPSRHASQLWFALNKTGHVIPLSIKDRNRIMAEQGIERFPYDFPDTESFYLTIHDNVKEKVEKQVKRYLKQTLKKRERVHALQQQQNQSIQSAVEKGVQEIVDNHRQKWLKLINHTRDGLDPSSDEKMPTVLRIPQLSHLKPSLRESQFQKYINGVKDMETDDNDGTPKKNLVAVRVEFIGRGKLDERQEDSEDWDDHDQYSQIFIASKNDSKLLNRRKEIEKMGLSAMIPSDSPLLINDRHQKNRNKKQQQNEYYSKQCIGLMTTGFYSLARGYTFGFGLIIQDYVKEILSRNRSEFLVKHSRGVAFRPVKLSL